MHDTPGIIQGAGARWAPIHTIGKTARHAGYADIAR
ncbi:DUF664 domain-containing protein [Nocardia otitidiscaviarum]|nr:DUF664 domain-containing protein [Nocardia otitidiscaviarum]